MKIKIFFFLEKLRFENNKYIFSKPTISKYSTFCSKIKFKMFKKELNKNFLNEFES